MLGKIANWELNHTVLAMDRDELLGIWQRAKQTDFAAVHDEALSKVKTWAWSNGPTRWLLPLGRELAPEIGISLDGPPKKLREGIFAYGLDARGEVRVIREMFNPGGRRPLGDWVTIVEDGPDSVNWVEYGVSPGRGARFAATALLDQGEIVAWHQVTNSTYRCHRYLRDDAGRIVTIEKDEVIS